jgi:hypothetical protein
MTASFPFYSPAAKADPPTPFAPINFIGVRSAISLAGSMGFRLPTAEEWQRAYQFAKSKGWEGATTPNLRDAKWEAQRKYLSDCVLALRAKGAELRDPPWPDAGIFIPNRISFSRGATAQAAVGDKDEYLFFAPSDPAVANKPLNNLIGNVAEYVADDTNASHAFVIGGSALSPREEEPLTPYELSAPQKLRGYSDVGFRPALSPVSRGDVDQSRDLETFRKLIQTAPQA